MSDTVIKVENLSKQYRLGLVGTGTITHDLNRWWHTMRGKEDPYLKIGETNDRATKGVSDYVWALKDINFEVKQGQILGVIGKNGAGKSTLLKLLSRVTTPTTGEIKAKGRIASLLEVGTGFHPELTGRDNIFLNGAILGMTKAEIKLKFDEIVEFSGTSRYIDTPVKRYSSGMRVRLAFAVAAHLEPEILIVDEVLAVGDAEFQKKAIGKIQDVSKGEGRTVLFVSHNMASIKALCNSGLLLENGKIVASGKISTVIDQYVNSTPLNDKREWSDLQEGPGNDKLKVSSVYVEPTKGNEINYDSGILISLKIFNFIKGENIDCTLRLLTNDDVIIFSSNHFLTSDKSSKVGFYKINFVVPPELLNAGMYKISFIFGQDQKYLIAKIDDLLFFSIENTLTGRGFNHSVPPGIIRPILKSNSNFVGSTE